MSFGKASLARKLACLRVVYKFPMWLTKPSDVAVFMTINSSLAHVQVADVKVLPHSCRCCTLYLLCAHSSSGLVYTNIYAQSKFKHKNA